MTKRGLAARGRNIRVILFAEDYELLRQTYPTLGMSEIVRLIVSARCRAIRAEEEQVHVR